MITAGLLYAEGITCMQLPWRQLSGLAVTSPQVLCRFREIGSKEAVSLPELLFVSVMDAASVTEQEP